MIYPLKRLLAYAGVADGVGGWAEVNVDPGIYSRLLVAVSGESVFSRCDGCVVDENVETFLLSLELLGELDD